LETDSAETAVHRAGARAEDLVVLRDQRRAATDEDPAKAGAAGSSGEPASMLRFVRFTDSEVQSTISVSSSGLVAQGPDAVAIVAGNLTVAVPSPPGALIFTPLSITTCSAYVPGQTLIDVPAETASTALWIVV
jgi:hypothetical protein